MGGDLLANIAPEGIAVLIAACTNRTVIHRAALAVTLHIIASEHPQAFTALLGMTADAQPGARMQAGYLITNSRYEAAVIWPVINRLLADPVSFVRRACVDALDKFVGDINPALPALTMLLSYPDPELSKAASRLLDKIKAQFATPPPAP